MKQIQLKSGPFAQNPKLVKFIIIHCSATLRNRDIGVDEIKKWHLQRGFKDVGYHFIVRLDGRVENGRSLGQYGAHCRGCNNRSVSICYIGGVDTDGKTPADTRTDAQKEAMDNLIDRLRLVFPCAEVRSHSDFAPKACPSFDATAEYSTTSRNRARVILAGGVVASCMVSCSSKKRFAAEIGIDDTAHNESSILYEALSVSKDSCEWIVEKPVVEMRMADSGSIVAKAEKAVLRRRVMSAETSGLRESEVENTHMSTHVTTNSLSDTSAGATTRLSLLLAVIMLAFVILVILKNKLLNHKIKI